MRRADYLRVGGMDERLFTGEDSSLCARLIDWDMRLRFTPQVAVFHYDRTLRGSLLQRIALGFDVTEEWRKTGKLHYYWFAPVLFILFLVVGLALLWVPGWRLGYLGIVGLYFGACLIASVQTSSSLREVPGTLVAVVVGNLCPGVGTLMNLLRIPLNLHKIYRVKSPPSSGDEVHVAADAHSNTQT